MSKFLTEEKQTQKNANKRKSLLIVHHNCAGHFLPEEDDKFLEKVQAAVEEEERQAIAAADTDAAKDAITTAESSRRTTYNLVPDSEDLSTDGDRITENNDQDTPSNNDGEPSAPMEKEFGKQVLETQVHSGAYDSVANLPIEFYHYYHGSNNDLGTLIEVIRTSRCYARNLFHAIDMMPGGCQGS